MGRTRKAYPTNYIIRSLVYIVFTLFAWRYRIKKRMPEEVRRLKSPYLVLGNHVGFWDPFVTGNFLPRYTHFVSSDAAFRSPVFRFFLTRLGTIPKKKNIRDTKVIRDIIAVIRQGENVGIFPEAVRNWAGSSFPLDPSIVKLIRLLKVPVVVPLLKGMNLFNPRWSKKMRRTRVWVDYQLLFTAEEVNLLTEEELFTRLTQALQHDEVEYQRQVMIPIHSKTKAEHISHALYFCPNCRAIDSFDCSGNDFLCKACGYDVHINRFGFFERIGAGPLFFDNIRDWYNWEEAEFAQWIGNLWESNSKDLLFQDLGSEVYRSDSKGRLELIGSGNVSLFVDKIVLELPKKQSIIMNLDDLQTINPQVHERLEIFYQNTAYRIVGGIPGVSALKWEVAVNTLWKKKGQMNKLSPYIKS